MRLRVSFLISLGPPNPLPERTALQRSPLGATPGRRREVGDGSGGELDADQGRSFIVARPSNTWKASGRIGCVTSAAGPDYSGHQRFSPTSASLPPAISVILNTSKITAVDQPNMRTPFIAVMGPSRCQRSTGVTSP
jgi:hypothetical protein